MSRLGDVLAMATAAMSRRDFAAAADAFTEAVALASLIPDRQERRENLFAIFERRAEAYLRSGDFEHAAGDGLQLCGMRPDALVGYLRIGEALRGAKRHDEALAYLRRGAEVAGESVQVRILMRAAEADIRIAKAANEQPRPHTFEVPDPATIGAGRFPTLDPVATSTTPAVTPRKDASRSDASHGEAPAGDPPGGAVVQSSVVAVMILAVLVAGVAAAVVLERYSALVAAAMSVVAAHAIELRANANQARLLGVPLSVWASAAICFAITWVSPALG